VILELEKKRKDNKKKKNYVNKKKPLKKKQREAERIKARALAREEELKRFKEMNLEEFGVEIEEEPEKVIQEYHCEVCSKVFRSEKQFSNHEKNQININSQYKN